MDKKAIITGASGAIGEALAEIFFLHGYDLILLGRSIDKLKGIKDRLLKKYKAETSLGEEGGKGDNLGFHPTHLDPSTYGRENGLSLSNNEYVSSYEYNVNIVYYDAKEGREREIMCELEDRYGYIDLLINGAGMGYYESLIDLDDKITKDVFEVNFFAPIRLTKAFLQQSKRPLGIINILSISAKLPVPFSGIYAASKAALYMEMESARGEIIDNVKFLNVLPGRIESAFSQNAPGTKYFPHGKKRANPKDLAKVIYNAFLKGKREIIWPSKYKFILFIQRVFPAIYEGKIKKLKERYEIKK